MFGIHSGVMASFSEQFCQRFHVSPERYVDAMFWRCLHPWAWLFVPIIKIFDPDFFAADYELIKSVARLSSTRDLGDELAAFNAHPGNQGLWRRRLKCRVSGRKIYRVVAKCLASREDEELRDSTAPFYSKK